MALRAFDDANVVEINQNEGRFPIFIGADGLGDLHLGSQLSNVNDAVTVIANMAMGDKRRSEVLDEDEDDFFFVKTVSSEMTEKPIVHLWTDSRIVLHWLLSVSISLMPFVGVRVAEIQSTWDSSRWKLVPTHLNPADDLSQGLRVQRTDSRWMHGPAFLRGPKEGWPELQYQYQMRTQSAGDQNPSLRL